jgi:hypothetical protein
VQARYEELRKQSTKELDEMQNELYVTRVERDDAMREAQEWKQHAEEMSIKFHLAQVPFCPPTASLPAPCMSHLHWLDRLHRMSPRQQFTFNERIRKKRSSSESRIKVQIFGLRD